MLLALIYLLIRGEDVRHLGGPCRGLGQGPCSRPSRFGHGMRGEAPAHDDLVVDQGPPLHRRARRQAQVQCRVLTRGVRSGRCALHLRVVGWGGAIGRSTGEKVEAPSAPISKRANFRYAVRAELRS